MMIGAMPIEVIAELIVESGRRVDFLTCLKEICEEVRQEQGCLKYLPTVDVDDGSVDKDRHPDRIVIIEEWKSLDDLAAHSISPHMVSFRKTVEAMLVSKTIKVLCVV
jgi:quinol monooxygenase YgiN